MKTKQPRLPAKSDPKGKTPELDPAPHLNHGEWGHEGSPIQSSAGEYLGYLSQTAMEFVRLPPNADLYRHVATRVHALLGDAIVAVTSYDNETRELCQRALIGSGKILDAASAIAGIKMRGFRQVLNAEAERQMKIGRLIRIEEGLYEALLRSVPRKVTRIIEKTMGVRAVYGMGCLVEDECFGGVLILLRSNPDLPPAIVVETFINQAALAMQKQRAEETVRRNEERFRALFECSHDAIMTLEPPSWRFTSGNPAAVRMFGAANEKDFIACDPWTLSPERQPDGCASSEKARKMIETVMREGSHFFEWTHSRIGGEEFHSSVLLTRIDILGKTILQATVRDITVAKQVTEELHEKNVMLDHKVAQLRKLALELTQTEERERKRLAVMLHDDIQQSLAAATMKISLIDRHATSEEHDRMVREALDLLGEILNSSRSLATDLYPPVMIDGGFLPGLRWLAGRMKERHGLTVKLSGEVMAGISTPLSILLFQGVRELLFNVVKHAGVKTASVTVNQPDLNTLQVVVNDHGVGFSGKHTEGLSTCKGLGMFHLRERLAYIGGSLDVASEPGKGTTVSITVSIG